MGTSTPPGGVNVDPGATGTGSVGSVGFGRIGGSDAQLQVFSNLKYTLDTWDAVGVENRYIATRTGGAGAITIDADTDAAIQVLSAQSLNIQDKRSAIQLHKGSRTALRCSVLCTDNAPAMFFGLAPVGDATLIDDDTTPDNGDPNDGIWFKRDGGASVFQFQTATGGTTTTHSLGKTVGFNAGVFNDFSIEIVQPPEDRRSSADDATAIVVARINNIIVMQKRITGLPDDVDLCWSLQLGDDQAGDTGTVNFMNTGMAHYGAEFDPAYTL